MFVLHSAHPGAQDVIVTSSCVFLFVLWRECEADVILIETRQRACLVVESFWHAALLSYIDRATRTVHYEGADVTIDLGVWIGLYWTPNVITQEEWEY